MNPTLSPENEALGWRSDEESRLASMENIRRRSRWKPGPDANRETVSLLWYATEGTPESKPIGSYRVLSPVKNEPEKIEEAASMAAYKFARENGYTTGGGTFTIYWYTTADEIDQILGRPLTVRCTVYKMTKS